MQAIIVSDNLDVPMQSQKFPREYNAMCREMKKILNADCEFHTTAWYIREQLPSQKLQDKHEELTIACDEAGFYKPELQVNVRASKMSGLRLKGTVVFFIDPEDSESGQTFILDDALELWEATKSLKET